MATSDSFLMDSLSESLLAAVTDTSFHGPTPRPIFGELFFLLFFRRHIGFLEVPLNDLQLPPRIVACYQRAGISSLFSWQAECLSQASANSKTTIEKRNFIFSAPGETLFFSFRIDFICFCSIGW